MISRRCDLPEIRLHFLSKFGHKLCCLSFLAFLIGVTGGEVRAQTTPAQPVLTLTASPSGSSTQGGTITLTATLSGYSGSVDGEVISFLDNGNGMQNVTTSSGVASFAVSYLPQGAYLLTATYSGDAANSSATSRFR